MESPDRVPPSTDDACSPWGQTARSVASLILFIHLFFMAVALAANHSPSPLEDRLLTVFRPYTQLLNFDVTFVRYDLTQATADDTDQRIEYLPQGNSADGNEGWVLLRSGWRGSDRLARHQRLAALLGFAGTREDNNTAARIAQSVGEYLVGSEDVKVAQIRCRRHLLQSPDDVEGSNAARRNPEDPSYFIEAYRAQTIVDPDSKQVLVQKVEERGQVAPPRRASGRPSSGAPESKDSGGVEGAKR